MSPNLPRLRKRYFAPQHTSEIEDGPLQTFVAQSFAAVRRSHCGHLCKAQQIQSPTTAERDTAADFNKWMRDRF